MGGQIECRQCGKTKLIREIILKEQNGRCAICGQPENKHPFQWLLTLDRNHWKYRGLLCYNCKKMLNVAKDSPEILRKAAEYLEKTDG